MGSRLMGGAGVCAIPAEGGDVYSVSSGSGSKEALRRIISSSTLRRSAYHYGRAIPKHAHGTGNLGKHTSSTKLIMKAVMELFDRIVDKKLLIRRINITANHVIDEASMPKPAAFEQLDLFTDYEAVRERQAEEEAELQREKKMQSAMLAIKKKFGKNAILKGTNLEEGATTIDRNNQIGGHKA